MTLDPRRAALWEGLNLGPRWVSRGGGAPASAWPGVSGAHLKSPGLPEESAQVQSSAPEARAGAQITAMGWDALQQTVAACRACGLCKTRRQTVFGVGARDADWMLIGEAPGADEDAKGEPFVGQAGRLLDNMLTAVRRARSESAAGSAVYIANVLKCRPPGNRNPEPDEVARCEPFLRRQIALVNPRLIVVMGRFAAQSLLQTDASIGSLRGRVHRYALADRQVPVVVTYHPAYLLRNPVDKAKSWVDLCLARDLGRSD